MYQGLERPDWVSIERWNTFWANVVLSEHGYVWIGKPNSSGYGRFTINKRRYFVHRLIFEWSTGVIPVVIDHTCSVRRCVTLEHLENVTIAENTRRTFQRGRGYQLPAPKPKTHCIRGHEYTLENTYLDGLDNRSCLTCRRMTAREWGREQRGKKVQSQY